MKCRISISRELKSHLISRIFPPSPGSCPSHLSRVETPVLPDFFFPLRLLLSGLGTTISPVFIFPPSDESCFTCAWLTQNVKEPWKIPKNHVPLACPKTSLHFVRSTLRINSLLIQIRAAQNQSRKLIRKEQFHAHRWFEFRMFYDIGSGNRGTLCPSAL